MKQEASLHGHEFAKASQISDVYIHVVVILCRSKETILGTCRGLKKRQFFIMWNIHVHLYLSYGHQSLLVKLMQKFPCVHRMLPCVNAVFVVVLFAELSQMAVQCT